MSGRNPEHPFKSPNFRSSVGFALKGIRQLMRQERNFQAHVIIALLVAGAGVLLRVAPMEWVLLVLCMTLMLAVEALNTAVEYMVDRLVGNKLSADAAMIKDVAAAACLMTATGVAIAGLLIFMPHLRRMFENG